MRLTCLAIFAGAICAAGPAAADAITYNIPFYGQESSGDNPTVYGPTFNPSLGRLTGVSVTITGTLTPDIFTTVANAPTSVMLDAWITLAPSFSSRVTIQNDGTYNLTQNGAWLTGPPEAFSFTQSTSNSQGFYYYTSGPAYQTTGLANMEVFLMPPNQYAWGGPSGDPQSRYSGNFAITYDYDVPEPTSLALLAFGAALLPFARATRKQR